MEETDMKKLTLSLVISVVLIGAGFGQVTITNTDTYYTADQMLLANEINESGEPFAEALGYNLDDLDPFVLNQPDSIAYTLGIENYEYSRYQLGTIISRSGMGLHMMWAPVISQMAAMEPDSNFDGMYTPASNGFNEDDELMKNIMHFSMLANHAPPGNPWPQFAEFTSGDPHLPQAIDAQNFAWNDFSTLRWDRSLMDKTLNLAAMGQTLMKQYLWAQDMLSAYHDSLDNPVEPAANVSPDSASNPHFDPANNIYFGGDALDGFIGQVLTAESINKVKFAVSSLAFDGSDLGMVDPATYDPASGIRYFPHKIEVTEEQVHSALPPKYSTLAVIDASSHLWDQLSFLWGTLSFTDMMNPDQSGEPKYLVYHQVFDGDPFPAAMSQTGSAGPFDLMKGTSKVLFLNIMQMHFRSADGTFVDTASLGSDGSVQTGNQISSVNAGYALLMLRNFQEQFTGTPLESMAHDALVAQADFLVNQLSGGGGRFYNGYTFDNGADTSPTLVESQAAAVHGLYAAFQATADSTYLQAANAGYGYLIDNYYVPSQTAFRTELGNDLATYTPKKVAILSGAMREAALNGGYTDAPAKYVRFFNKVANVMQLSEGANTGESGNDSDNDGIPFIPEQPQNLPPVFATEATLDLASTVGIDQNPVQVINAFTLAQNYPNPFNPETAITFTIQKPGFYQLDLYNVLGQKVRTLVSSRLNPQQYSVRLNASGLSSGVYYYQLTGKGNSATKKLLLLK